jgi:Rieske Fe-S protein
MIRTRRRFLVYSGAACGVALCGVETGCSSPSKGLSAACTDTSSGTDPTHCLVEAARVRVVGAANLAVGQAVLTNVDDNTAVIVARDSRGLHALSAICTHACCIVSLCSNAGCTNLTSTPGECSATRVVEADPEGEGIFCPCHGSTFRLSDGVALTGPASTSLPAYAVSCEGNDIIVDTGATVDPMVRI